MLQRKDQVEHNKKKNRILDLTNMTHLLTIILASLLLSGCKNTPSAESVQAEFLKFCSQFPDCFDEVIPPLVDRLVMCKHFEKWK